MAYFVCFTHSMPDVLGSVLGLCAASDDVRKDLHKSFLGDSLMRYYNTKLVVENWVFFRG